MKRYLHALKNRRFPLVTLFVLLAIALGYYLFYVRSREVYFTHRYQRLLASESGRLEERLSTLESVFANYQSDETLTAEKLKNLPGLDRLDSPPPDFKVEDKGITLTGRIERDRFWIYAGWRQKGRGGEGKGDLVVYRFEPFVLAKLSPPEDFDTLFVATRDGTVLYQQGEKRGRELWIANLKKFLADDGKEQDLSTFAQSTSQIDVSFAGTPYKLFLRPCCNIWEASYEQPSQANNKNDVGQRSLEWVVGGAVRSSILSTRSWQISFTVGITLIALFVLSLLSLPFLRVFAIGAEEKVRMADALWVGFTAIVGVGLLTIILLDLHAYQALTSQIAKNLEKLAGQIDIQMNDEITEAWSQLDSLNGSVQIRLGKRLAQATDCKSIVATGKENYLQDREPFIWHPPLLVGSYTDFERFTWTDSTGQQCFKWSLGEATDPLVHDVTSRHYFRAAIDKGAAIEPIFSVATGNRVLVLASRINSTRQPFVGVLGIEMSSLNWPVLPPGYGFAVVDETGDVLFHSQPRRAGYENFFEETDNDSTLKALVDARRSGYQEGSYMGRGHQFWVKPIMPPRRFQAPPLWTLIVFSDKGEKRAFNVDVVTTAMLFLVLYLLVYMVGCWLLRAAHRSYRAGWLWPEKKGDSRDKVHLGLTVLYLLALVAYAVAIYLLDGIALLWFAFAFSWAVLLVSYRLCVRTIRPSRQFLLGIGLAVALLLIYLAPGGGKALFPRSLEARNILFGLISLGLWGGFFLHTGVRRFAPSPPRWIYLAAASLLLTLTAAMPALAFFCVAHRAHIETRIKRGQLELARGLELRDERIQESYAEFRKTTSLQDLHSTALLNNIVKQRLGKHWDLYAHFFFNTPREEQKMQPSRGDQAQEVRAALLMAGTKGGREENHEEQEGESRLLPQFAQKILPLYNEDFIHVRWLFEDADPSGDLAWRWMRSRDGKLELVPGSSAKDHLISVIPSVSLLGVPLLWPFSLLFLGGVILGVARFIAQKFFFFGLPTPEVIEPRNMVSVSAQNFILVSARIDEVAKEFAEESVPLIDLRELASREDLLRCLERADLVSGPKICLHHFEYHLQDQEHNLLKLELMEELILGRDKPVVVLSHVVPAWYLLDRRPVPAAEDRELEPEKAAKRLESVERAHKEVQERWRNVLRRFLIWVYRDRANTNLLGSSLQKIRQERASTDSPRRRRRLERLLALAREECSESEQLQSLAGPLVQAHLQDLSRDLFIDDLRERAESYYRTLWAMCTEEEKLILVQLAEGGLVNPKNSGALKMLMKRGLVKRDPSFKLMNESFRRYIAGDVHLHEIRALEQKADASTWGQIRGPFIVVLIGVAAFFFITQRQVFDVSMAFFSAIAASLPALFRVVSTVSSRPGRTVA
jgi:hypothetical protein